MKLYPIFILLLFLCSCSVVDIEDYVHEPTNEIRNSIVHWEYGRVAKLTEAAFIVVPNFRTFSRSFSSPSGWVYILDKSNNEFYVESVSLKSESKPEVSVTINEKVSLDWKLKDTEYSYTKVSVFKSDTFDIETWNNQPVIIFTIKYSVNGGEIRTTEFKLQHKIYKEVAWPT